MELCKPSLIEGAWPPDETESPSPSNVASWHQCLAHWKGEGRGATWSPGGKAYSPPSPPRYLSTHAEGPRPIGSI